MAFLIVPDAEWFTEFDVLCQEQGLAERAEAVKALRYTVLDENGSIVHNEGVTLKE